MVLLLKGGEEACTQMQINRTQFNMCIFYLKWVNFIYVLIKTQNIIFTQPNLQISYIAFLTYQNIPFINPFIIPLFPFLLLHATPFLISIRFSSRLVRFLWHLRTAPSLIYSHLWCVFFLYWHWLIVARFRVLHLLFSFSFGVDLFCGWSPSLAICLTIVGTCSCYPLIFHPLPSP